MKPENKFRKDELNKVAGGVNEPTPTEEKDPLKLEVETQKIVAPEDLPKVAGGAGKPIPTEEKDPLKLEVETQKTVAPEDLPKVAGGKGPLGRVKKELQLEKIDPDSFPIPKFHTPKLPPRTKSPLGGPGKKIK